MDAGELRSEIEMAINRCCAENGSNTPDFVLAEYMVDCLAAFDRATNARDKWYGDNKSISPTMEEHLGKVGIKLARRKLE